MEVKSNQGKSIKESGSTRGSNVPTQPTTPAMPAVNPPKTTK